jgi:predicted transcriptional regulator of viral defense system
MAHPAKPQAIEFSGTIQELAHTLGLPMSEIRASIGALIERGHLERISHGTYRLFPKPAR